LNPSNELIRKRYKELDAELRQNKITLERIPIDQEPLAPIKQKDVYYIARDAEERFNKVLFIDEDGREVRGLDDVRCYKKGDKDYKRGIVSILGDKVHVKLFSQSHTDRYSTEDGFILNNTCWDFMWREIKIDPHH